jgi:hypothetical protein
MTGKSDTGGAEETKISAPAQEGAATEKDEAGKSQKPRRIVRSRSTAVAGGEGEAGKAEGGAEGEAAAAAPAEGDPAAAPKEAAPRPPRHDMRAPARPAGSAGARPRGPRPGFTEGMPQRPPRPGALPSRPRPEGMPQRPPRPGALPGEGEGERRFDPDRPRPPRGDRPPRREGGPRGDRPRFGHKPGEAEAKPADAKAAEAKPGEAKAAQKPAAPAQKPAAPAQKPAAPKPEPKPQKPAAPAPLASAPKANKPAAVFVPLARAGQVAQGQKPVALTPKEALAAKTKAHAAKAPQPAQPRHEEAAPPAAKPATEFGADALAASWDNAKTFIDKAGDAAAALVDAWLAAANAVAIAAVADANDVGGAGRKAARRALAVLKSRGIAVPEKPKSAKADERSEALEATMIPCDSFGTWSVAITSRDATGRYRIAEVIGREPAGVIQAAGGWLSGSQLKEGRARAQNNVGMAPVVVPLAWARARVAAALSLNAKSGQVVPLGYESCRELFEAGAAGDVAHPVADLEEKVTSDLAAERAKVSASLHEEPEFGGWLPDRRGLDEMMQKVGERIGATGLQDPEAVNAAIREETDAATDRYFVPEVREQIAARMRDSAISVRSRKGDERALDVLATARAVREAGLITSPPREIPFLVAFFQKALGALARMGGGQLRIPVPQGAQAAAPAPAAPPAEASVPAAEGT